MIKNAQAVCQTPLRNLSAPVICVLLTALIPGCASFRDVAVDPSASRVLYYESDNPETVRQEKSFVSFDGADLGFAEHRLKGARAPIALVYLHGIESHGGWVDEAADGLAVRGFDVFCLDRRGSGINRENRDFPSGHVDSYQTLFKDMRAFIASLRKRYESVFLVGLSWGGKQAMAFAIRHPGDIDGLILITPGIAALVDVNIAAKINILLSSFIRPKSQFKVPIRPEMFTSTPHFLAKIRQDPLRLHYASARFLMQSNSLERMIEREMHGNHLPILLFLAGEDRIINNAKVVDILKRGSQEVFDVVVYEDQTHSIQFDAPNRLVRDMERWLQVRAASDR